MNNSRLRPPQWFIIILIAAALPLLAWPSVMAAVPSGDIAGTLAMLFPIYAIVSLYLAYRVFPRRPDLSWILIAILLLSYGAMAWLVW